MSSRHKTKNRSAGLLRKADVELRPSPGFRAASSFLFRRRGALKASTALIGFTLGFGLFGAAIAGGGAGGGASGGSGAGGSDFSSGPGGPGIVGGGGSGDGGGGGGGAGLSGGSGGNGGMGGVGGPGGASAGAAGTNGDPGPLTGGGGGGGGGGAHGSLGGLPAANVTGGKGGNGGAALVSGGGGGGGAGGWGAIITGTGAFGELGFTTTGGAGGNGGGGVSYAGNAGSGGYGLAVLGGVGTSLTIGTTSTDAAVTGGVGGRGGDGLAGNRGGSGGNGGAGLVITGSTIIVNSAIVGGNGGTGGNGSGPATGGTGGAGGVGISTTSGAVIAINAAVRGGLGGLGGAGASAGARGALGEGIVGDNLTVTLGASGSISDGDGAGGLAGNALRVTGSSKLTVVAAGTAAINGTIEITSGTLTLDQTASITIANTITGAGALAKTGTGTVILSGTNTYTGGTTISAGTLVVSSNVNLGGAGGAITLSNSTGVGGAGTVADAVLRVTDTFASSRAVTFANDGGGRIEIDAGKTLTLSGPITTATGSNFIKQGAGELALTGDSSATTYLGRTWVDEGTLRIEAGGKLGNTTTGEQASISNGATAIVTGPNSVWATSDQMKVGEHGSGSLRIEDGGAVKSGAGTGVEVGQVGAGGASSVTITGAGSQWLGHGTNVFIGHSNAGTLTLSNGGTFELTGGTVPSPTTLYAGLAGGSAGGIINIGAAEADAAVAAGQLVVDTVALNTSASQLVFNHTGSTSFTPSITGLGSLRQIAGTTILSGLDNSYSGETQVLGGTLIADSSGGFSANSNYTVATGATLKVTDGIVITDIGSLSGSGAVEIGFGTTLRIGATGQTTTFSGSFSGNGSLDFSGTGSQIYTGTGTLGGDLSICSCGSGSFVIRGGSLTLGGLIMVAGGALVVDQGGQLDNGGAPFIASSTVLIDGAASRVTVGDTIIQGVGAPTAMTISGGATLSSAGFLGPAGVYGATDPASVLVTGAGSRWTIDGGLEIGVPPPPGPSAVAASVTVAAGAALAITSGDLRINTLGTLNIGNGGTAGTVTLAAGTIVNGGAIVADFTDSATLAAAISGSGGLTKAGTGTLTLSGTSSYSGATTVSGGSLIVNGALATASVQVGSGATLGGSGTIAGAVTIAAGGTLSPGNSPGTLTVASLTLNAGSNTVFELNNPGVAGGPGNDLIIVNGSGAAGNLRLGGTLTANVASAGYYRLFDVTGGGTISGAFDTLVLSAPSVAGAVGRVSTAPSASPTQVDLVVLGTGSGSGSGSGQGLQFWDGADLVGTGTIEGGSGTWNAGNTNWAVTPGESGPNGPWRGSVGVFQGAAGTVSVVGTQDFDTLQFNSDGYVLNGGSLRFAVAGGGTINISAGVTTTIGSSLVAGAGDSLAKVGAGTLVLAGTSTYTGTTNVTGGVLRAGAAGAFAGGSAFTVAAGASLDLAGFDQTIGSLAGAGAVALGAGRLSLGANNGSTGFSGTITGAGGLTKQGTGTLTLSGTSSYAGATNVTGGVLRAGAAGAFAGGSAFTLASGTTLDLAGFDQTIGSLAGAGAVALETGRLSTGGSNASTSFAGAITGAGGLTKQGTGTLTLSGASSYTGPTLLQSGRLVVDGALASPVSVNGGVLGGSGSVGGLSLAGGGTVAPGNSIGRLSVSGNVAFAAGSTYQVEVDAAGNGDRIVASGAATLAGGTVQVLAQSGNYAAATSYVILSATGGVSGGFGTVTSSLAFLTPTLAYGGNAVTLTMTRNDTGFGPGGGGGSGGGSSGGGGGGQAPRPSVAQTRNQGFIAVAAEPLGAGNPVYDTLLSSTAAEARAGFDLLSGEAHAQAVSVMIDESRMVRETVLSHLRGPLLTASGSQVAALFSADLSGGKDAVTMPAPLPQPRYAFWGTAFGGTGNADADGNAGSLSRRGGGALLGADILLYDAPGSSLKVGVAGGYSQSRFDLDARLSSGRLESGHAALYAGARFGNLRLDAGAAYTWSESDIRRQVAIRGFGDLLRLERPGQVMQGFAELGYGFAFGSVAIEPFAQLALIRVSTEAGSERGGAAALRLQSSEQTLGFTTLGLRAEAQLGAMPLFARAMLGWRHGFGELTPQVRTGFVLGTTPARVFAAPIDRDALVAEAGLDWRLSNATAIGLTYSAAIGERARDHAIKGKVEVRF